ncbi:MAG: SMP-30/gluconolactonase/LRE family protein [Bacteroidetes bacterium]|nr:SMP-30/gluconolactonase/LRE family protein [Bacteroidota bacterium]
MNTTVEILAEEMDFPEGPAFDPNGSLWCVELEGGNIVSFSQGTIKRFPTGGSPNGLIFDDTGSGWFCDAKNNLIRKFLPKTSSFETVAESIDGEHLNKPNDLIFDTSGNLIFTCPGNSRTEPTGFICCRTPEGKVSKIAEKLYFPNGLVLTDEGKTLIIAETFRQRLWKGRWNSELHEWTDASLWSVTGGSVGPDGMALNINGLLYVAVYGSGQIKVVDETGRILQTYNLPGMNPTNAAFDPSGHLGLIVTEAEKGLLISLPEIKYNGFSK